MERVSFSGANQSQRNAGAAAGVFDDVSATFQAAVLFGRHDHGQCYSWVRGTPYPKLTVRHNLPHHALQAGFARAGMGLTMLPCFLGDREPGLVRVPGAVPVADRGIWLLLRHDLRSTARVRAFVDFIAAAILDHRGLLEGRNQGLQT